MQVHRVSMTMCGMHSGKHPNVPTVLGNSRNGLDTYTVTMQSFLLIVILQSPMNHTTPSSLILCTGSDGEEVVLWEVISDIQKSIRLLATLNKLRDLRRDTSRKIGGDQLECLAKSFEDWVFEDLFLFPTFHVPRTCWYWTCLFYVQYNMKEKHLPRPPQR